MNIEDIIDEENDGRLVYTIADAGNLVAIAVAAEREAIAKMFDGEVWAYDYREIAAAIRARGGE